MYQKLSKRLRIKQHTYLNRRHGGKKKLKNRRPVQT